MERLECIQRRFLWGGGLDQNKIAWVKWETICLPKEKGGLGIKDINNFNLALLGKWKWSLFQNHRELWARVLESKYGGCRSLDEASRDTNDSIWWRDLKMALHHPQQENAFHNGMVWRVGCGDRIKLWEDRWIDGEATLLAKYPRLYLNSCQQNQLIQQMGAHKDTGWEWDFKWRRHLFDSELTMAASFLNDVVGSQIQPNRRDDWAWKPDPSGQYSAKSAYDVLKGDLTKGNDDAVFEELWKLRIPTKVLVFAWRLLRDRLPTKVNLRR